MSSVLRSLHEQNSSLSEVLERWFFESLSYHTDSLKKKYINAQITQEMHLLYYVLNIEWKFIGEGRTDSGLGQSGKYEGLIPPHA